MADASGSTHPAAAAAAANIGSIHTVEGNVAGSRAALLEKKRQRDQEEFELRKRQIHDEHSIANQTIESKFASSTVASEQQEQFFKSKTVGLVTAADFTAAAEAAAAGEDPSSQQAKNEQAALDAKESLAQQAAVEKAAKKARKKKLLEKKKMLSTLSFAGAEEEDDANMKTPQPLKDPTVDTSFLPDVARDQQLVQERARLEQQWQERQEQIKHEQFEVTYSYWDGSGHRRSIVCTKGDTIGDFLEAVRKELCKEFRELGNISGDALIYVKEDLIIPQDLTFYDLIATKARGKSGPLFHFDVHDDVRLVGDATLEKDESHPGKVVERRWYDRNKHIFPASRWETYDPIKDYGGYTIGDKKKKK